MNTEATDSHTPGAAWHGRSAMMAIAAIAAALLLAAAPATAPRAQAATTEQVSVSSADLPANNNSFRPSISADGRYVAFDSLANNLVLDDSNGWADIFVHDRLTGITERVSVSSAGAEANSASGDAAISANGRYVAFASSADNLVAGDTNERRDVFVHDRLTEITERVSVGPGGIEGDGHSNVPGSKPAISGDGRYVAFDSDANNLAASDSTVSSDVFVRDRQAGVTQHVSVDSSGNGGNGPSSQPTISDGGGHVAFVSGADNLVPNDDNVQADIFVRQAGSTERISLDSAGSEVNGSSTEPAISDDGLRVAFTSGATNLVPGNPANANLYVRDRQTGTTHSLLAGLNPNGQSTDTAISGNGRYVAFRSLATNLVPNDTSADDIFLHDRQDGTTERVSVDSAGTERCCGHREPAVSADGRFVAFRSPALNLVPGNTNGLDDIYVRDRGAAAQPDPDTPQSDPDTAPQPQPQSDPDPAASQACVKRANSAHGKEMRRAKRIVRRAKRGKAKRTARKRARQIKRRANGTRQKQLQSCREHSP